MSVATAGPCDRGVAAAAPESAAAATHPTGTLAATILGSSLAFIDGSVVNVGLPAIERDLASSGASGATIGWLINAYLLPLGALVLLGVRREQRDGACRGLAGDSVARGSCSPEMRQERNSCSVSKQPHRSVSRSRRYRGWRPLHSSQAATGHAPAPNITADRFRSAPSVSAFREGILVSRWHETSTPCWMSGR